MKLPNKADLSATNCGVDESSTEEKAAVTYEEKLKKEYSALKLEHEYDEARIALSELIEDLSKDIQVVSAGIGLKSEESDFILKLEILDAEQKDLIPKKINGIEVQTIVGALVLMQGLDADE